MMIPIVATIVLTGTSSLRLLNGGATSDMGKEVSVSRLMGQPMRIVKERKISSNVMRFDLDRSITGTAHETYSKPPSGGQAT